MTNTYPTQEQISKWDDEQLKHVHSLLFDNNVDPRFDGEPAEWVNDYLYEVHGEYQHRFHNQ